MKSAEMTATTFVALTWRNGSIYRCDTSGGKLPTPQGDPGPPVLAQAVYVTDTPGTEPSFLSAQWNPEAAQYMVICTELTIIQMVPTWEDVVDLIETRAADDLTLDPGVDNSVTHVVRSHE